MDFALLNPHEFGPPAFKGFFCSESKQVITKKARRKRFLFIRVREMKNKWVSLILFFLTVSVYCQSIDSENIDKNFLLGNYDYRDSPMFVEVSRDHAVRPLYLNSIVYEAFIRMFNAAGEEGISLKIISGTRNFDEQKVIWERKWKNLMDLDPVSRTQKILEFSSMPATSRHHWGTDIDLNNLENSYFESGKGKEEYEWLVCNAYRFGFYQVYTSKETGRPGYAEEKWHWSYMPLAALYLQAYNELVSYADIDGFEGSDLAEYKQMIHQYVNGISLQQPEPETSLTSLLPETGNPETDIEEN